LAVALANAGFSVQAVCPSEHPMDKTRALDHAYPYSGLSPLASIAAAIGASAPDLLVPCDDLATRQLHLLHQQQASRNGNSSAICTLIERSLGSPQSFPVVYERTAFMEMAHAAGVRVPKTALLCSPAELETWIAKTGLPLVLKSNGTSGGEGVRIVHTADDARCAFRKLQAPPRVAQGLKRALIDHDKTLVWPSLRRSQSVVNAQEFVRGREATSLVVCRKGAVLASLHFEVIHKLNSSGPATVLRLLHNPEMASAATTMVRRLNLSGFHGFDFMLEDGTDYAYLIEINPRTTQVGHLALGEGRDLPAAIFAAVSGQDIHVASKVTDNDTIALFPGEWTRNPLSTFLRSAYHDAPWEEPELIRAGLQKHQKQSAWYSQKKLNRSSSLVGILPL
jgi:glutathione synthase/RimK-type ligase-like ATP-grasp enzyme